MFIGEGCIQTFTGEPMNPLMPDRDKFNIEDIAHALSNMCRFTGHTKHFYSVAQHCVLASIFAEDVDPELARSAFPNCHTGRDLAKMMLMHDASEAYLIDLPRPLKDVPEIGTAYKMAEHKLMVLLADVYRFKWPMCEVGKIIDNRLLFTEKRDLLAPSVWSMPESEPFEDEIEPWTSFTAKRHFLNRFHQLFAD